MTLRAPRGSAGRWAGSLAGLVLAAVVPARLLGDHLGPHDIVGLETDARWCALLAAAQLRQGGGEAWRSVGTLEGTPIPTAFQALLGGAGIDAGQAWGWTLAAGIWLVGVGATRLARRHGAGWGTAAGCGFLVQVSPVVLGAVPEASVAALSVGAIALGFADARWAWLASGWSVPGALAMAAMGVVDGSRRAWGAAGWRLLPSLALGALVVVTTVSGAKSDIEVQARGRARAETAPAYVGEGNAVFPLPEGEAVSVRAAAWRAGTGLWLPPGVSPTAQGNPFAVPLGDSGGGGGDLLRSTSLAQPADLSPESHARSALQGPRSSPASPDERPTWGAALVPLQRLHLGPVVVFAMLAGGCRRWRLRRVHRRADRAWTLVAGVGVVGLCVGFGFAAAPGELVHDPAASARLAGALGGPTSDWRPWAAPILAACVVGIAAALEGLAPRWRALAVVVGVAASVGLENPRLRSFGTPLPPDPVLTALAALPHGDVLVFPAPRAPWRQGQRPASRVAWELADAGSSEAPPSDEMDAWTVALARAGGAPVDIAAAERAWQVRAVDLAADGTESPPVEQDCLTGPTSRVANAPLEVRTPAGTGGVRATCNGATAPAPASPSPDAARLATPRYLLVNATALTPVGLAELERWLTPRMGAPVARSDARLLYDGMTLLAAQAP